MNERWPSQPEPTTRTTRGSGGPLSGTAGDTTSSDCSKARSAVYWCRALNVAGMDASRPGVQRT
eukprot:3931160-Prymnesium_polylepis.2